MSNSKPAYGGQAVVEGVMFGGKHTSVTTIRRKDGTYDIFELRKHSFPSVQLFKKIPLLRGVIAIIESNMAGSKHLNFSSDMFETDHKDNNKIISTAESYERAAVRTALAGLFTLFIGKLLFIIIPVMIAECFTFLFPSHFAQNALEGFFKVILLISYIYFISLNPFVHRVFQFHGAEHKVINAYEKDLDLTIENVQKQSRLHYRCGSSFILFTVVVGMLIFLFIPFDNMWERLFHRIVFIPVILGIAYEALQFSNKVRDIPIFKWIGYPGLALQQLTTKEPNADQMKVAIASFKELVKRETAYEKERVTKIV